MKNFTYNTTVVTEHTIQIPDDYVALKNHEEVLESYYYYDVKVNKIFRVSNWGFIYDSKINPPIFKIIRKTPFTQNHYDYHGELVNRVPLVEKSFAESLEIKLQDAIELLKKIDEHSVFNMHEDIKNFLTSVHKEKS